MFECHQSFVGENTPHSRLPFFFLLAGTGASGAAGSSQHEANEEHLNTDQQIALLAPDGLTDDTTTMGELTLLGGAFPVQTLDPAAATLQSFSVSGVADGVVYLEASDNVGGTIDVGELCENASVSFIVDISKFVENANTNG